MDVSVWCDVCSVCVCVCGVCVCVMCVWCGVCVCGVCVCGVWGVAWQADSLPLSHQGSPHVI